MLKALRLTQAGDLAQAAALLMRALNGTRTRSPLTERDIRVCPDLKAASSKSVSLQLLDAGNPAETFEPTGSADAWTLRQPSLRDKSDGQFLSLSFSSAAGTRAYKLYIPSGYQGQPRPLIVMLHGCTQSPDDFANGTRMNALGEELTCLVAYPEQSAAANRSKCWNWFDRRNQQRDCGEPALIAGITRQVMQDYAVDRRRVYVAGMSAGAAAAAILAATYSDLYAALGVHSGLACGLAHDLPSAFVAMKSGGDGGSVRKRDRLQERTGQPIPTIVFHGDRDATVHPRNSDRFTEMLTENLNKRVEGGQVHAGHSFTKTTYTDASGHHLFEKWVIHGAGHAWSGGSAAGSYTDPQGPDASREIMRFLLSHQHPR